jgi:NAD(P)-dependent dehydrogenase (short-subunit alcohol dehydrogenase family)
MLNKLDGKVAVITGAGRGLGKLLALRFAQEGARLLLPDINLENAENTAQEVKAQGGEAVAMEVDIADEKMTLRMADKVIALYGKVDILVNNAALIYGISARPWDKWTVDDWNRMFTVNVTGTWLSCKAIAPHMIKQSKGKIINVASDMARLPAAQFFLTYACSKAAVWTLTQGLASALGPSNINVNALAPGRMATEAGLQDDPSGEGFARVVATQIIKKRGEPEDMLGTAVFLASADSDYLTGQVLILDGGALMI